MTAIFTKYHGPTEVRGSRIIARSADEWLRVIHNIDNSYSIDDNHDAAARKLCLKMGWSGLLHRGDAGANERVYVWDAKGDSTVTVSDADLAEFRRRSFSRALRK